MEQENTQQIEGPLEKEIRRIVIDCVGDAVETVANVVLEQAEKQDERLTRIEGLIDIVACEVRRHHPEA